MDRAEIGRTMMETRGKPDAVFLSKIPTRQLLSYYKHNRFLVGPVEGHELLKKELDKREHVLSKDQSKLVRTASKKVGRKLSLQEAQKITLP